ncbi:MAG: winged helix-turn-helix transcriptional regulator [bacterium]
MARYTENGLTDKELEFVNYIAQNTKHSQRDMSVKLGYSLGLTNIIIKRLVKMGYVKTKQLDKKKVKYMLTPKGFLEKTRKSYNYFLRTIDSIRSIKTAVKKIIENEYSNGEKSFIIIGKNELAEITELVLRDLYKSDITYTHENKSDSSKYFKSVALITHKNRSNSVNFRKTVNMLEILPNYMNQIFYYGG